MSTSILRTTSENATASVSTSSVFTSSASKKQNAENQMYVKQGSAKRKSDNIMEEAVSVIKTLCKPDSKELESNLSDAAHTLDLYIAARLHEMKSDERRLCENEILKLLSEY